MNEYPVGYCRFHPAETINYQVNRWLPTANGPEFIAAARGALNFDAWHDAMVVIADRATREGRHLHAATYLRAAEFFLPFDHPAKAPTYDRYLEQAALISTGRPFRRIDVPYRGGMLPTICFAPDGPARDTLLIHGGFDSYVEEFLFWGAEFAGKGYEVVLFEGPGQGAALRKHGLTMDAAWEHPIASVLDYHGVGGCSLIGVSLGGCLAPRAAAFEPRIQRVVALNVLDDFLECFAERIGPNAYGAITRRLAAGDDAGAEEVLEAATAANPSASWAVGHGQHISGSATRADYLRWLQRMSTADVSHRITQDILLIAGSEDHIVPVHQLYRQAARLTNARSVTTRLFTTVDQAQAHCQVGNIRLVLDVVAEWLDFQLAQAARRNDALSSADSC